LAEGCCVQVCNWQRIWDNLKTVEASNFTRSYHITLKCLLDQTCACGDFLQDWDYCGCCLGTANVIISDSHNWHYIRWKNLIWHQAKLALYLSGVISYLPKIILYLWKQVLHQPSLFNVNITDFISDFYIWYKFLAHGH
jgi:hypothetical protein